MNLENLMNLIIAHACPSRELEDGWREYRIETHCVAFVIEAIWTNPRVEGNTVHDFKYEVRSVKIEDC